MPELDAEGRERKGVYLPVECWEWLERAADRDGSSRNDLLEGIVLLAMDQDKEMDRGAGPAGGVLLRGDDRVAGAPA